MDQRCNELNVVTEGKTNKLLFRHSRVVLKTDKRMDQKSVFESLQLEESFTRFTGCNRIVKGHNFEGGGQ